MCTTFKLQNSRQLTLSQNYDFYYGHGLIIQNNRGVHKVALCDDLTKDNLYDESLSTPRWVSKYGSISFNQFAREVPTCGMNEAGLSIASMWHDTQRVSKEHTGKSITELQWIQYQLDCYSTVDEVIDNLLDLDLRVEIYPMHYSVCDRKGDSAIIELKSGKLQAFRTFESHACSNAGLEESLAYALKYSGKDSSEISIVEPILDRASKALFMTKEFESSTGTVDAVKNSFDILDAVSLQIGFKALFKWIGKGIPPSQTFWQIVFDINSLSIHFKTKNNRNIRTVKLLDFNYSNSSVIKVLDIEAKYNADVTDKFKEYSRADNDRIVKTSFKPMKDTVPLSEQNDLVKFPELLN